MHGRGVVLVFSRLLVCQLFCVVWAGHRYSQAVEGVDCLTGKLRLSFSLSFNILR